MPSRPEQSAEFAGRKRESGSPRNVLSTIASAMFLGGCLLICGLCAGGFYFFQPDVRDDPDAVDPLMAEILDVDIPPEFEARGVIEWNVAFVMSLRGTYYEMSATESDGELLFVEASSFSSGDPEVQTHIRQALREKAGGVRELELMGEVEHQPIQVRGEEVMFDFETRRDPVNERTYRVIEGVVDGKNGQVLIGLRFRDEDAGTPNLTIAAVSGVGPWDVTMNDRQGTYFAAGDALWDESSTPRKYQVIGVSGDVVTVVDREGTGSPPSQANPGTAKAARYWDETTAINMIESIR